MSGAAAFFDLDRTLLRRSSALALAGSFRDRGLIDRRQMAKAAAWQARIEVPVYAPSEPISHNVPIAPSKPSSSASVSTFSCRVAETM